MSHSHQVSGFVKEEKTLIPIPYTTIIIKGTTNGFISDEEGFFSLTPQHGDTLLVSFLGYKQSEYIVREDDENMIILLEPEANELTEVTIVPDVDYAKLLFKRIIKNKKENQQVVNGNNCLSNVNSTTIYLAIDSGVQRTRLLRNVEELSYYDKAHGAHFSPIFLSEEANEIKDGVERRIYTRKDGIFPKLNQTIESLIMEYLVVDIDPYKNNIYIFDKNFVSPLSNNARMHYDIYLNDSSYIDGMKFYNFTYTPKNKFAPLFTGRFSVDSEQYALKEIDIFFHHMANVNFVNGFKANIAYKKDHTDKLFLNHQNLSINLSLFENRDSSGTYASERVDNVSSGNWMLNKTSYYSTLELDPLHAHAWREDPDFEIDSINSLHYHMVDKIKQQPMVRVVDGLGSVALTGYLNLHWLDLGPVFDIYSNNAVEGHRFSLPVRTNENVLEHLTLGGFVGYGTRTKEFKFGANIGWQPLVNDKLVLRANYTNDYVLVSQDKFLRFIKKNPNTRGSANFIAALTTSQKDPYIKETKHVEFRAELNADKHYSLEAIPYFSQNISTPAIQFIHLGTSYNRYNNYGMLVNWRIAYNQSYDKEYFARIYYITPKPIFNIAVDFGKVDIPNENDAFSLYSQIHGSVVGSISLGQMAMRYMLNAGYLYGEAPYDMLDMPVGSRSLGYAKYRYNLLYQAAFAHNAYSNAHLELSGGGILLNYFPLLRRLKWREVVSLKSHYGVRNDGYEGVFDLPSDYDNEMSYPYAEIGVGITNIFKILRVEYIRQLGEYHVQEGVASKQGLRFRAEMSF